MYCPELLRHPSRDACTLIGRFRESELLTIVDGLPPNALTIVVVGLSSPPCSLFLWLPPNALTVVVIGLLSPPRSLFLGPPPNALTIVIVGLLSHGHRHVRIHRPEDELYVCSPDPRAPVQIDKMAVKLYPIVDSTMKPLECAHAFQINKTALAAPGIDRPMMLDTLGAELNLSAIIYGILGNWTRHFQRAWCNFANLTILSFHNDAGNQVNDTTAADPAVLLPLVDGQVTDCRKKNIRFVRVQLNLDFASLVARRVLHQTTSGFP